MAKVFVVTVDAHSAPDRVFANEVAAYAYVEEKKRVSGATYDWRATGYEVDTAPAPEPVKATEAKAPAHQAPAHPAPKPMPPTGKR